jgi:hypothetical protein
MMGIKKIAVSTEKTIRDTVEPAIVVPINQEGRLAKKDSIRGESLPSLPSSSSCNLFVALYVVSMAEKKKQKIRETSIPESKRVSILFLLPQDIDKIQDDRKHNSPVGFSEAKRHGLMDTNDKESNREREDKNVNQFHADCKNSNYLFLQTELHRFKG